MSVSLRSCSQVHAGWLRGLFRSLLFLLVFLTFATPSIAEVKRSARPITASQRAELEALLTEEIQRVVDSQERVAGQAKHIKAEARLESREKGVVIVINLSRGFLPRGARYFGAEMEDKTSELANMATELLRGIVPLVGVTFRYDGKKMEEYLPDERSTTPSTTLGVMAASPREVVSAGHGYYYHFGFNDWRPQRDPANGITEDFITPIFAGTLQSLLNSRSDASTFLTRSTSASTHAESGEPWWQVAALAMAH